MVRHAHDPAPLVKGLAQSATEADADVFHGMMRIDVDVTFSVHLEIDQAVAGDLVQQVVEHSHAGADTCSTGTVEVQRHPYARLSGYTHVLAGAAPRHARNSRGM